MKYLYVGRKPLYEALVEAKDLAWRKSSDARATSYSSPG